MLNNYLKKYSSLFLRVALGSAFLSAVAIRFGWWKAIGQVNPADSFSDWPSFVHYTAAVGSFLPESIIPLVAFVTTILEIILGIALILGLFTRVVALVSGFLLLSFALSMTISFGIKSAFDYSVFSASAGAFLLANCESYVLSFDSLNKKADYNNLS